MPSMAERAIAVNASSLSKSICLPISESACWAQPSRSPAHNAPDASTAARSAPMKQATTGFLHSRMRAVRACRTLSAGLREISTIYSVSGSFSSASMPISMLMPPTCSFKSLPPVPIVCETPLPASCRNAATCWIPQPDAPQIPNGPRLLMLDNTNAAPLMLATPQSGPMHRSPFSRASSFISRSCSRGTLLLNTMQ